MEFKGLIEALEKNVNYKKDYVEVYGIGWRCWGESYFTNIAFDNEKEAFDYLEKHYSKDGQVKDYRVIKMTYNKYGGLDIGWENGEICYNKNIKYIW